MGIEVGRNFEFHGDENVIYFGGGFAIQGLQLLKFPGLEGVDLYVVLKIPEQIGELGAVVGDVH